MTKKHNILNAHNGKQVKSTRQELFIALKYLLEKCPDAKHTSKTVGLEKYAQDSFNAFLDRRRANDIFNSLMELTTDIPGVLPFVIKRVEGKPRYYIQKTAFETKEIESITKAVLNDQSISARKADKIIDKFLNAACNQNDKEKILSKLLKNDTHKLRLSEPEMENKEYFEMLRDTQKRFYFKLKRHIKTGDCTDLRAYTMFARRSETKTEYAGIVFEVYTIKKQVDVCIYLPDYHHAIITHIENIELNQEFEPTEQWNTVSFYIGENQTIESFVEKYYSGKTGIRYPIKFAFPAGDNDTILQKLSKSFYTFFNETFEFERQSRVHKIVLPSGRTEEVTVTDIIARAKTAHNYESFRKWFWDGEYHPYETVTVIFPAAFNDRLLGPITNRFRSRIDNYGYESENGKKQREAVRQKVEERRRRLKKSSKSN